MDNHTFTVEENVAENLARTLIRLLLMELLRELGGSQEERSGLSSEISLKRGNIRVEQLPDRFVVSFELGIDASDREKLAKENLCLSGQYFPDNFGNEPPARALLGVWMPYGESYHCTWARDCSGSDWMD